MLIGNITALRSSQLSHHSLTCILLYNHLVLRCCTPQAAHDGVNTRYEEMTAWKHFTRRDEHIYMSMSTSQPVVNNYAVFTVRTSIYVPHLYYMVRRHVHLRGSNAS